jgi:hypothetical protein
MKSMADKKMDMTVGKPKSEGFFPEEANRKVLARAGDIKGFKYPDTEESIMSDQQQFVRDTSKNMPKPEFRH